MTPEAMGDYILGPSHVLPTNGASKNSSGLSVYNFIKKISSIGITKNYKNTWPLCKYYC